MQNNTVLNISDEDLQYIVIREDDDSADSKSEHLSIGEKKPDEGEKDPIPSTGSAVKIAG